MNYALIGDSQGQGLWRHVTAGLEAAGHQVVLSRAQPGWDAARYQKEGALPGQLAAARPDVVVFMLGGNNAEPSLAKYSARVGWALQAARAAGAGRVFWMGPAHATRPDVAKRHEMTAELEARFVPGTGAVWLDSRPYTQAGHADGVHFTPAAYKAWAAQLVPQISVSAPPGAQAVSTAMAAVRRTLPARHAEPSLLVPLGVLSLISLIGLALYLRRRPILTPGA